MKTITLSKSEIETLKQYLMENPCRAHCVHDYKRIDCGDCDDNGKYKCKLLADRDSILEKIGFKWGK